jgi:hypothetical protein
MKYALMIGLSFMFLSCSKSHDDDPAKKTALTTGTWKLTAYLTDYNKDGTYEEDTYSILDPCLKDNIYTFQPDGNEITDEGPVKCFSTNPQTSTSPWSFQDNQSKLQFEGITFQIEQLTTTSLKLNATRSYNVIYTRNVKLTYTKQ